MVIAGLLAAMTTGTTMLVQAYHAEKSARAKARYQRGRVLAESAELGAATAELRAAVTLDRGNTDYALLLARTLADAGAAREAQTYLDGVLAADPTDGRANLAQAGVLRALGDHEAAEAYYRRAWFGVWAEGQPQRALVGFDLAEYLLDRDETTRAIGVLSQLAVDMPDAPAPLIRLGTLLLRASSWRAPRRSAPGVPPGPEDPALQMGAGVASRLGRTLRLSRDHMRQIAPVGAAAGIAAAFNTPITAVLFVIEEVLSGWDAGVLGSIVLSAVAASVVTRTCLGDEPLFQVRTFTLTDPSELLLYGGIGLVGGLVSRGLQTQSLFEGLTRQDGARFPTAEGRECRARPVERLMAAADFPRAASSATLDALRRSRGPDAPLTFVIVDQGDERGERLMRVPAPGDVADETVPLGVLLEGLALEELHPDDRADAALELLADHPVVAVVGRGAPTRVLGILRREQVRAACGRAQAPAKVSAPPAAT